MFKLSYLNPPFDQIYKRLESNIPSGTFYIKDAIVVPHSVYASPFLLETDRFGIPVEIQAVHIGITPVGVDSVRNVSKTTIVPSVQRNGIKLQLGKGRNIVSAREMTSNGRSHVLIINTTNYSTVIQGYARQIYSESDSLLTEQTNAIMSDFATRLMEPLMTYQDLIPNIQSLQILASKFAARAFVHEQGTEIGVKDLIAALTQATPYLKDQKNSAEFIPIKNNLYRASEDYSGKEAHVWMPNLAIANWLAFIKIADNIRDMFEIVDITEEEVIIKYQGEIQRHRFDFDDPRNTSITAASELDCFNNIQVMFAILTKFYINMCAAAYTFDWYVVETKPIGRCRLYFDLEIPFDQGCEFDTDPIDPLNDGWVSRSLVGRLEGQDPRELGFDSFTQPAITWMGPLCVYEDGFYMTDFSTHRADIAISASGSAWGIVLP